MLLDNDVLPPVLVEARKTLSLTGDDVIRIADRNYQILHQAKFVTSPPTWRDYLWMDYNAPETPDKSLLPKNNTEQIIWVKYIDEGWEAGLLQATIIFKENISRLKRDYEGMIRYRRLLAQNMVSAPFVATMDLGITGNGSNMTVNDRVLRITAFPTLQADGSQWKTEITPNE
jgi:defect-in-organelle-trafficking protein DotC